MCKKFVLIEFYDRKCLSRSLVRYGSNCLIVNWIRNSLFVCVTCCNYNFDNMKYVVASVLIAFFHIDNQLTEFMPGVGITCTPGYLDVKLTEGKECKWTFTLDYKV